jgi:hypothetical protein
MFSHVLNDVTRVPNVFPSNPMCSSVERERKREKKPTPPLLFLAKEQFLGRKGKKRENPKPYL